ncbi:MAG: hypothetical protein D6815_04545 [Candidatus Dadabacteria bacterium]|nr:MAG: hypothetical protein D6815_04545 [Candidatus Dadabacteria bacterium]
MSAGRSIKATVAAVVLLGAVAAGAGAANDQNGAGIHHFGSGEEAVEVSLHGKLISIYADHVPADVILDYLRQLGGPTYSSIEPLTRPVTLTLHRVTMERMLEVMLWGYNYALEYRDGRIAHVRVLRMVPGRSYRVRSPVETRSEWLAIESQQEAAD